MNKIAIVVNKGKDPTLAYTKRTVNAFINCGYNVFTDLCYKDELYEFADLIFLNNTELYEIADLILVLGGDGSMLGTAKYASRFSKPIIGVNLGRLGYISEIDVNQIEALPEILKKELILQRRSMLDVCVYRNGEKISDSYVALNDAVVTKSKGYGILDIDLYCGNSKVTHYRADGLILATPTGSTGYSLSVGGPVIDPSLDSICVSPICAHSLRSRPIVFSGECIMKVSCINENVCLVVDGEKMFELMPDDEVFVKKSEYVTHLIKTNKTGFCDTLYKKMSEN